MQNEFIAKKPVTQRVSNGFVYRGDFLSTKILIILIGICATSLFLLKFLGKGERVLELLGIGIIVGTLLLFSFYYGGSKRIPRLFNIYIGLLFFMMLVSAVAANVFQNQSLKLSLYEMRPMYYLLFYFLIQYLAPRPEWVKNFFYWMAMAGAVLYILQYLVYPAQITEAKMFIDRGTLRINLPGTIFRHICFFLCVTELFRKFSLKYGIGAIVMLVVAILSAYRSVLAMYILLPSIYLLTSPYVKNRLMIILLGVFIMISGFFAFQSIIFEMQETALRESAQGGKENIRFRSASYFIADSKKNPAALIIGNGQPSGHSRYGQRMGKISEYYGYYLSDIGIIGTIYRYGLVFALIIVLIMFRILSMKLPPELHYIKLFLWMHVFLIFSTYPFYEDKTGILLFSLIMYLAEHERFMKHEKIEIENRQEASLQVNT